jgi:hypothetical protein
VKGFRAFYISFPFPGFILTLRCSDSVCFLRDFDSAGETRVIPLLGPVGDFLCEPRVATQQHLDAAHQQHDNSATYSSFSK